MIAVTELIPEILVELSPIIFPLALISPPNVEIPAIINLPELNKLLVALNVKSASVPAVVKIPVVRLVATIL